MLAKDKPDLLFVQNPSMILASLACIYQVLTGVPVIVDRHTTFQLTRKYRNTPDIILFKILHWFTLRTANWTIVTNQFLADIVGQFGGRPLVLPDKLPEIICTRKVKLKGRKQLFMISSFGDDEPIREVISAMESFAREDVCLYISGNYNKVDRSLVKNSPENVIFTGFLTDQDFINLLYSVDAVVVLTTSDYCMLCGCYEAFAATKPLITSEKSVLTQYFNGAVFVDNTTEGIAAGIHVVLNNIDHYTRLMSLRKTEMAENWNRIVATIENHFLTVTK